MSKNKAITEEVTLVERFGEWPHNFTAMWAAGAATILIIAALFTVGPGSPSAAQGTAAQAEEVLERIDINHAGAWRDLGFTDWTHDERTTVLYIDSTTWFKLPEKEQKKRIGTVGAEFAGVIGAVGGNGSGAYIMVHDEKGRMPGEYDGAKGARLFTAE